ncbi:MAG: ABC transporter transmembrane domain-containing protein [Alphaproteobacteria bacterium]
MSDIPSGSSATDPASKKRKLRQLARVARFLKPYRKAVVGALFALLGTAGTVLAMPYGVRRLIDQGFHNVDSSRPLDFALLGLFALVLALAVATYARYYLVSWLGERVTADIRRAVYNHVIGLSPGFFEITKTGEVLSRITTDTTLLQTVITSQASQALRNLLLLLGGFGMMAATSPKLTGMAALIVPVVVVPILLIGRQVRHLSRQSQARIGEISAHVEETVNAVRTVQAFGQEETERRRFADGVEKAFAMALRMVRARALLTALVILIVFSGVGVVLWAGGHDVLAGRLSPGELFSFLLYAVVLAASFGALSEVYGDLQRAAGATARVFDLLASAPQITTPAEPKPLPEPPEGRVSFEGVTFRYPTQSDRPALEDFALEVAPGETIAIVGPSGAGKTTVFQLLLRFYDTDAGRIRVDGVDLSEARPEEVRARFGLVPQEPVIFAADGAANIRYGRPEATDAEVRAAADAAAATEFLDRLPEGFASFLGERGVRLSGGQRQRIAIARAILRDPAVLLLDEATSALDAESERAVQEALEKLMAGRTTIVIAHRLATVLKADRIVVMDRGRVVAQGSHAALIEEGGLYARLAALQFDTESKGDNESALASGD